MHLCAPRHVEPINNGCFAVSLAAWIADPESAFVILRAGRRHVANEIRVCGNRLPHLLMSRSLNDKSHAFVFYMHVLANDIAFAVLVTRIRVLRTTNVRRLPTIRGFHYALRSFTLPVREEE